MQTKQKVEHSLSFLIAEPHRKNRSLLKGPSRKLKPLDKQTPKHQERNNRLILSLSLLHQTKKKGDITTAYRTIRNLRSQKFSRSIAYFPLRVSPYLRERKLKHQLFKILIPKKTKNHSISSLHMSLRLGSELSRRIHRTIFERRDSLKSDS